MSKDIFNVMHNTNASVKNRLMESDFAIKSQ